MPHPSNPSVPTTNPAIEAQAHAERCCAGAVKLPIAVSLPVKTNVPFPTELPVAIDLPVEMTLSMKHAGAKASITGVAPPTSAETGAAAPCDCEGAESGGKDEFGYALDGLTPAERALVTHVPRSLFWQARKADLIARMRIRNGLHDLNAGVDELADTVAAIRMPTALLQRLTALEKQLDELKTLVLRCCRPETGEEGCDDGAAATARAASGDPAATAATATDDAKRVAAKQATGVRRSRG